MVPMKKNAASIVFAIVFLARVSCAGAETITLAADEWCPYNCSVIQPLKGFVIDIMQEVFAKEGIGLRYVTTSWEDALEGTRAGVYNAAIGAAKYEAPDFIFPEQEIGRSGNDLFTRSDDTWEFRGPESFHGKRLGGIRDYYYGEMMTEYLEGAVEGADIIYAMSAQPLRENLERLLSGQIDIIVDDYSVVVFTARDMGIESRIRLVASVGIWDPVYVAFSPAKPRSRIHAAMLDKGIERLRSSGKLAKIMARYGLKDWQARPAI